VTALLKRDHGIDVKSASSTIEEVVARQFVDRLARQRNIALPSGDIFAETPVAKGKKPGTAKKAPEPPKPAAPALPPPRLVKMAKPAPVAAPEETEPTVEHEPLGAAPVAEAPAPEIVPVEAEPPALAPTPGVTHAEPAHSPAEAAAASAPEA